MSKEKAYRRRCREQGLCPHCGKPCAPYRECEARRAYRRDLVTARKAKRKRAYATRPDDPRRRPQGARAAWAETDDAVLAQLIAEDVSLDDVATCLGRTEGAVRIRAARALGRDTRARKVRRFAGGAHVRRVHRAGVPGGA